MSKVIGSTSIPHVDSVPMMKRSKSCIFVRNKASKIGVKDMKSPLNFDTFIPFICYKWDVLENIVVNRKKQDDYIPCNLKMKISKKLPDLVLEPSSESTPAVTQSTKAFVVGGENTVLILAYYDDRAQLVHVCIPKHQNRIPNKVMKAINYCLPYHSALTKLTVSKGLTREIVREISEHLPRSNLTEICLDDSHHLGAKYHILLDNVSQLKYLSLCRCNIGDFECIEIATRMTVGGPAAESLQILDLTSNLITDLAAQSFGNMLKRNRRLVHLNLSGNQITDEGASYLLKSLMEYPLTSNDIIEKRCRKINYLQRRAQVYQKCLQELSKTQKTKQNEVRDVLVVGSARIKSQSFASAVKDNKGKNVKRPVLEINTVEEAAQKMTNDIVGRNFVDMFDANNIVVLEDGSVSCFGNLKLCYLNLAYNSLGYESLRIILDVLKYQDMQTKPLNSTGLIRLVIEGNDMPVNCRELDMIQMYLKKVVDCIIGSVTITKKQGVVRNLRISTTH